VSAILDAETLDVLIEAIGEDGTRGVIELFLGECQELTAAITAPDSSARWRCRRPRRRSKPRRMLAVARDCRN
jgi:hypothetical protein